MAEDTTTDRTGGEHADRRRRARRRRARRRAALLLAPFVVTFALAAVVWILASRRIATELLGIAGLSIFGLGMSVVFSPALVPGLELNTWELGLLSMYVNTATAFLYAYNLDLLERVPRLGPFLQRARENAVLGIRHHPWIRRLATFGTGFFVFLPMPGSGSLGGCIVGRIVGLSKLRSFITVSLAGAVVSTLYAWSGDRLVRFLDALQSGWAVRIVAVVVALGLIYAAMRLLQWLADAGVEEVLGEEAMPEPPDADEVEDEEGHTVVGGAAED